MSNRSFTEQTERTKACWQHGAGGNMSEYDSDDVKFGAELEVFALDSFQRREKKLTDESRSFLRLASISWFTDNPWRQDGRNSELQYWLDLGREIVNEVVDDERLGRIVRFPTIVRVVTDVTDRQLRNVGFK